MKKRYNSSEEIKKVYTLFEKRNLIPKYTELFAYASSINILFLVAIDPSFREYMLSLSKEDGRGIYVLGILSVGIILSLVHIFISREKKKREKLAIQNSILLGNVIIVIYILISPSPDGNFQFGATRIYALINAFYYFILMNYSEVKKKSLVIDDNIKFQELIIVSLVLMASIAILKYWAALSWQLTYNISTTMIFVLTGILQKLNTQSNIKPSAE